MVQIICADISGMEEQTYRTLYQRASDWRKDRADRYRNRADAARCLTAEALLRFTLGTGDFTEEKEPGGKPYIREKPEFHYNLSHSGRWVVLACGDSPLGVDVEMLRPETDIEAISSRFFSQEEQCYIREDPTQSRRRFFQVWTGKESYVKFLGTGLKTELRTFSIFRLPSALRLHHRWLDANFCLCLCTAEEDSCLRILEVKELL